VRILGIKLKQIGDVLLWEPALKAIKTAFPKAELHIITSDYAFPVIKKTPYIDKFFIVSKKEDKKWRKIKSELSFISKIRKVDYDLILNFSPGDRSHIYSYLIKAKKKFSYLSKKKANIQKRIFSGLYKPPDTHTILQDVWFVSQVLGIKVKSPKLTLYLDDNFREVTESKLRSRGIIPSEKYVCVHPVAGWFLKCLPPKTVAGVIFWLIKRDIKVVVTSGKTERERAYLQELEQLIGNKKGIVTFKGDLLIEELCWIIDWSSLFFGIDTAPMHMAAALNVPVIAVFGPTGKHNWGPWENQVAISDFKSPYKKRGSQRLGKHFVIQKDWECIPCGGKKDLCKCDIKKPQCLTSITVSDITSILESYI